MNTSQQAKIDQIRAARPEVKFTVGESGKNITMNAEGWPEIVIGPQGGIDLPAVRSWSTTTYPKSIDAALVADQLLAKQIARDNKKTLTAEEQKLEAANAGNGNGQKKTRGAGEKVFATGEELTEQLKASIDKVRQTRGQAVGQ